MCVQCTHIRVLQQYYNVTQYIIIITVRSVVNSLWRTYYTPAKTRYRNKSFLSHFSRRPTASRTPRVINIKKTYDDDSAKERIRSEERSGGACVRTRTWLTHTLATVILYYFGGNVILSYTTISQNGFWQNNYNVYSDGRIAVHVFRCVGNKSVCAKRV